MDEELTPIERDQAYFNKTLPINRVDLGRVNQYLGKSKDSLAFDISEMAVITGYLQVAKDQEEKIWTPYKSGIILDAAKDHLTRYGKVTSLDEKGKEREVFNALGRLVPSQRDMFIFNPSDTKTFPTLRLFEMILATHNK